jgi:SAM-dependent methyltransferase
VAGRLEAAVARSFHRSGRCRAIEVGAGHGAFTEVLASTGARVTVTEMSGPSADHLRRRFAHNEAVRVVYDPGGDHAVSAGLEADLVVCVSVLHHVPDYLGFVAGLSACVTPGGSLVSYQDPLWYPRRGRLALAADRACYFAWRAQRGNFRQGAATRLRRLRGELDPERAEDMAEYHVVRQGVDEEALASTLAGAFDDVRVERYWSTQGPLLQRLGERWATPNTFGVEADGRQ